uniref:HDC08134 n=1 Tax=Drosophila melanogaster TaxID=7227 RepID=Q6ILY0_DROME|nr:TPA_inf: HDC08134 [Drosophila melanogaster]
MASASSDSASSVVPCRECRNGCGGSAGLQRRQLEAAGKWVPAAPQTDSCDSADTCYVWHDK